jgi:hypothetical protein
MKYTYEIPVDFFGNLRTDVVIRVEDQAAIPCNPANSDYQAYLNKDNPNAPTAFQHQPLVEG